MSALYLLIGFVVGLQLLSFVLVGIGLFFKVDKGIRHFRDGRFVRQFELPEWMSWLHNLEDGLTGDDRGWFWFDYFPAWVPGWFKMWWWSAWRNPFNYLKRFVIGIDVRQFNIEKLCGVDYVRDDLRSTGFQILVAHPKRGLGLPRPMLYWVRRWGHSSRAIVWQLGWKIKLSHNEASYDDEWDYFKGLTFELQLFKDIS